MRVRRAIPEGARRVLPSGTLTVGVGLGVAGLTAYGFLMVAGRTLGAERSAPLSALWALVFLAGPGFFLPLEQEVARALAGRRTLGLGGAPVIRRAAVVGFAVLVALLLFSIAGASPLLVGLLDHEVLLFVGLLLALAGYSVEHLTRGVLSGNGRFGPYGLLIGTEGVVRLTICVVLAVAGVTTVGPYGIALGAAPFAAVALGLWGQRGLATPGPDASWGEVSSALGWLLAGSILGQLLINAGPLAVKALASSAEDAQASRFLAGLVIARIPLFLFQAVQASMIPALSSMAAAGKRGEFRRRFRQLAVVTAAMGVAATLGALAVGPDVVSLLFGSEFRLDRDDLALLAAASAAYVLALLVAQALIAMAGYRSVVWAWACGVATFAAVTASLDPLLLRVELGFLSGSVVAAAVMGVMLAARLDRLPAEPPPQPAV